MVTVIYQISVYKPVLYRNESSGLTTEPCPLPPQQRWTQPENGIDYKKRASGNRSSVILTCAQIRTRSSN